MRTLHATASALFGRPIGTSSRRPAVAIGSVFWAAVATLVAISAVALGGPVSTDSGIGGDVPDTRWVMRLGRPYRPLKLTPAEPESGLAATLVGEQTRGDGDGVDAERWWTNVGVPEGVRVASQAPRGSNVGTSLDGFFSVSARGGDAGRFFSGRDDSEAELRKAEAGLPGRTPTVEAYRTYTAAASMTRDGDRFLGLAAPVFGSGIRASSLPALGMTAIDGSRSANGVNTRGSVEPGDAVPVGTAEDSRTVTPAVRPRTTAKNRPVSGGIFTAILGNGGGLLVWQMSRRRRTKPRAAGAIAG